MFEFGEKRAVKADLSPCRSVGPRAGPPRRTGHCTPPPPTLLHPHRPRSPPAAEEVVWAPQTPAPRRAEVGAARLRLEEEEEDQLEMKKRSTETTALVWVACTGERDRNRPCWMHLDAQYCVF